MGKNIFVYADKGTSRVGVASLIQACKNKLGFPAKKIYVEDILKNALDEAIMIIMPGGAANPYCEKLNGEGNRKIRRFVENGGTYLGICAGAYYACTRLEFHGEEYDVKDTWELGFFKGIARGSLPELTGNVYFSESVKAKAFVPLNFEKEFLETKIKTESKLEIKAEKNFFQKKSLKNIPKKCKFYYHGGPAFIVDSQDDNSYKVIARFDSGLPAVIKGEIGKGNYLLSSVHFELQKEPYNELVVKTAAEEELKDELKLYDRLNENYGNELWEEVKKLIRKL